MPPQKRLSTRTGSLLWLLRSLAILVGAAHAGISIHDHMMNEDGIAYLDLGDRYARGQWTPINSVWSPLYPLLLGLAVRIAEPSPRWEFAVAHIVTFGIYVLALVCFEFFWRSTWRALSAETRTSETTATTWPVWAWWVTGYALFVWSSVVLIRFRAVTPDMLVAALVYLAAGSLVQVASTDRPRRNYAFLGVVLGAAYLAKAVMFPLAFAFLAAAGWLEWRTSRQLHGWLFAPTAFLAVAAPLVLALSADKGRLTFGEAGRFTYLKYINQLPYPYRVDQIPAGLGTPVHPTRLVHQTPAVYEFATPVPGTYPLGYDPSYWVEGVSPRLEPGRQLRMVGKSAAFYAELFLRELGGLLAVTALLLWMGREAMRRNLATHWPLALIGVASAALGLYALVYVEGRYVAPFVILLWGGLLGLVRLPHTIHTERALLGAGMLLPLLILVELAAFDGPYVRRFMAPGGLARERRMATERPDAPWRIAEAMHRLGIQPGDPIGFIGYSFGATFARLARVRIVAEMPWAEARRFWGLDPGARAAVLRSFAGAGAVAVISEVPPPPSAREGWTELDGSGRYAILVTEGM